MQAEFDAVAQVLSGYFDGLHHGDTTILKRVFHSSAQYASAT